MEHLILGHHCTGDISCVVPFKTYNCYRVEASITGILQMRKPKRVVGSCSASQVTRLKLNQGICLQTLQFEPCLLGAMISFTNSRSLCLTLTTVLGSCLAFQLKIIMALFYYFMNTWFIIPYFRLVCTCSWKFILFNYVSKFFDAP